MKKPASLRAAIVAAIPSIKRDPTKLSIFIEQGSVVATAGPSTSFECQYEATLLLTDFPGQIDDIAVPLLAWLRIHQPELAANPDRRADGIRFEAEILNAKTVDLAITVKLSERVIVNADPATGKPVATYADEPSLDPWAQAFP